MPCHLPPPSLPDRGCRLAGRAEKGEDPEGRQTGGCQERTARRALRYRGTEEQKGPRERGGARAEQSPAHPAPKEGKCRDSSGKVS